MITAETVLASMDAGVRFTCEQVHSVIEHTGVPEEEMPKWQEALERACEGQGGAMKYMKQPEFEGFE